MPLKYPIRRRRFKKRRYAPKKRTGNYKKATNMLTVGSNNSDCLIADRIFTKLCYAHTRTLAITTTMDYYQFRNNSLYDPDYSGIGHQPRGFDQFALFFRQYRVHAVTVELEVASRTPFVPYFAGIYWDGALFAPPTTKNGMIESKLSIVRHSNGNSQEPIRIKKYLTNSRVFGRSKAQVADKDYASGIGNNPATSGQITIFAQAEDETASVDLTYNVKLTYFCEFNTPQVMAQST